MIEVASSVDSNPAPPEHPGRVNNDIVVNDFLNNGHDAPADPQFRWNGVCGGIKRRPLSNEALAALRDAAKAKGKPLSNEESAAVLAAL